MACNILRPRERKRLLKARRPVASTEKKLSFVRLFGPAYSPSIKPGLADRAWPCAHGAAGPWVGVPSPSRRTSTGRPVGLKKRRAPRGMKVASSA